MQIANPIPERLARVGRSQRARPSGSGREEIFLTASEDVEGLSAGELPQSLASTRPPSFYLIEFPTSSLEGPLASPIREEARSFSGFFGS